MKQLVDQTRSLVGLTLSPQQIALLGEYEKELQIWNQRISLTAIDESQQIRTKHFLDSFSSLLVMKNTPLNRLIDIGTGAGFPGIPLKIILPETEVLLVDSVHKKTDFCRHIIDHLDLKGIDVVHDRVEHLGRDSRYREQFDWGVARAVAQLSTLAEYLLPLVRIGGKMLAMKGDQGPFEAQKAGKAVGLLGGELQGVRKVTLPGVTEERFLITIAKKATTPDKYPRRVGVPGKKPL
ncbi:MAG: 16S rRNA (guanine(527)-N(7))-methyltransferase RsmG [Anaerolineales bacterium]|jgi:16S rRNA (guanine527-N7)-methyltransferase